MLPIRTSNLSARLDVSRAVIARAVVKKKMIRCYHVKKAPKVQHSSSSAEVQLAVMVALICYTSHWESFIKVGLAEPACSSAEV